MTDRYELRKLDDSWAPWTWQINRYVYDHAKGWVRGSQSNYDCYDTAVQYFHKLVCEEGYLNDDGD